MTATRRIGLLQAGYVHPDVAADTGDYPALFADLLRDHPIELVTYDLQRDGGPTDLDGADDHDGWIISGSASSVYEDESWIRDLEDLCRTLVQRPQPVVGICFGHQVLARALGAPVAKADVGWGAGVHEYRLVGDRPSWIDGPAPDPVRVVASHQDQVLDLPPGAQIFLTSPFCPIAGFTVANAMTIQPHPEFTTAVSKGLIDRRRELMGPPVADAAAASLSAGTDAPAVAGWIAAFLAADT